MKYKVVKEYCGIPTGKEFNCDKPSTIRHMVKKGYWKKIEPIKAKVEPTKRKKKIEPIKKRLKK